MKTNQKSLQKVTETEIKINEILALKQITNNDINPLSQEEADHLYNVLTEKMITLKGDDRDLFLKKIDLLLTDEAKNQLWESNHNEITYAISTLMQEFGRMPSKSEIANKCELSRQTIYKHMNDYATHPQYLQQIEQFRFMSAKVLAKVFKFAVDGDISAAKLYFNIVGMSGQNPNNTFIQNQNNYIQINGTVLSQETIKKLNPDQLNTIENILKSALPQAVKLEVEK